MSQISKEHVEKPSDVLNVGQEVTAKIVDFNENDRKISLSIKAMAGSGAAEANQDEVPVDIDAVISAQAEDDAQ